MKIKSLEVFGLHGVEQRINLQFNSDVNILTGRNGSGKTTILKLLWYVISGNIERAIQEVEFQKIVVETDPYTLIIDRSKSAGHELVQCILNDSSGKKLLDKKEQLGRFRYSDEANGLVIGLITESIFFPTFRRIEGGFSVDTDQIKRGRRVMYSDRDSNVSHGYGKDIQDAIANHARRLSVDGHRFVSSISTVDVQL